MRKTKNIILPTKCLNQMGFLLLFLSCPVIGDWGRIRPDTEMSQWSIIVEKEGTCGLMRDPPGINDEYLLDGSAEHGNKLEIANDTLPKAEDSSLLSEMGHELTFSRGIETRRSRSQSERRLSREMREERSARFDSANAIRYNREVRGETREGRRLATETLRRLSQKAGNERIRDSAERRFDVRRGNPESATRNEEMISRRIAREERSRRVDRTTRNVRNERRETERQERRDSRSVAREEREERKQEMRRSREVIQTRRLGSSERRDAEDRQRHSERRISNQRERTDEGLRTNNRRQERKTRSERMADVRRIEIDRSRRQDGLRRLEKSHRQYVVEREALDRCSKLEPFTFKQKKPEESRAGEFFSGIKNWFKHKIPDNSWVGSHGDFATTCLVGAAAYLLTTHHNKSN